MRTLICLLFCATLSCTLAFAAKTSTIAEEVDITTEEIIITSDQVSKIIVNSIINSAGDLKHASLEIQNSVFISNMILAPKDVLTGAYSQTYSHSDSALEINQIKVV